MSKKKQTVKAVVARRKKPVATDEMDSVYLVKLVLYLIAGSFWMRMQHNGVEIPIPVGFMVGLLFTAHEKFKIDRKVEYALLLVAAFVGFWLPLGLVIQY